MLKVTVAEVQRSLMKQFGINLGAAINAGNFSTTLLSANALPLTAAAGLGKLPVPGLNLDAGAGAVGQLMNYNGGPSGDATSFGNSGFNGGLQAGQNRISHALRALERDGLVKTLAEPNLTAVSGESAKFLAGGEFPIPFVDSTGQTSVIFKEFGIGVAFTPIVLSEGRISLKIETEVSELTNVGAVQLSGLSIPALEEASGEVDGRVALGRIARARRPALGGHPSEHRRLPRPQGCADPRHAVPSAATSSSRRPSSWSS